jgi:hypothetical protein
VQQLADFPESQAACYYVDLLVTGNVAQGAGATVGGFP